MGYSKTGKIVIAGGGSGGHLMPAVSVIEEMKRSHPELLERLVFIGGSLAMEGEKDKTSLEERVITQMGVKFVKIRSGKLQRNFSFRSFKLLWGVLGGVIDAWKFFKNNDVALVFSTGGYVATPVCFAAWAKKVPVVIHEQTTSVGLANKLSSYFATKVLLGFKDAARYFPTKKSTFTGNPIRSAVVSPGKLNPDTSRTLDRFNKNRKRYPVVFVSGGGQGSHLINECVRKALKPLLGDYQLICLTGDNEYHQDYDRIKRLVATLPVDQQDRIYLSKFASADEMGRFYEIADLYVGRGGANTVYELGVKRRPALLIPIPWVTHNEQNRNAKVLEEMGLAEILPEGELSADILMQRIQRSIRKISAGGLFFNSKLADEIFVVGAEKAILKELLATLG